jgi:pyruvate formate lyase activating enzyme
VSATLANRQVRGLVSDTLSFSNVDGPGNRFVIFLQGCNFDCIACHNPQTIPGHAFIEGHHPRRVSVDDMLVEIRRAAPFIRGITVSGGEATQQPEFLQALFAAVKDEPKLAHLTCFVDSNGACDVAEWDHLAPVMDGAMIDLKCLDPEIHLTMTGHSNGQVLRSITHLQQLDLLEEVRMLLLSGVNDEPELLRRTAEWLADVDPNMRIKLIGFRKHGARPQDPPIVEPTHESLQQAAEALRLIAPFDICVV